MTDLTQDPKEAAMAKALSEVAQDFGAAAKAFPILSGPLLKMEAAHTLLRSAYNGVADAGVRENYITGATRKISEAKSEAAKLPDAARMTFETHVRSARNVIANALSATKLS
jgi:hypothetical protein